MRDLTRVFVSYAREDEAEARKLYKRLLEEGLNPWLDKEHLVGGEDWDAAIRAALEASGFIVLCLSRVSVAKQGYLRNELKVALDLRRDVQGNGIFIVPVRLDSCDIPQELRHLQWIDLYGPTGWKDLMGAIREGALRTRVYSGGSIQCLNCGAQAPGNFCLVCGQKTSTKRLDVEEFIQEVADVVIHVTSRAWSTLWEMTFRPGQTVSGYIYGKRKSFQNPVSYFAVAYLVLELCSQYVFQPAGFQGGVISNLHQRGVTVGMTAIAVGSHFLAVYPQLYLVETITIFLFVYGTMFAYGVILMILEVGFREPLASVLPGIGGAIIDVPLIVVLLIYFGRITVHMRFNLWRVAGAVLFGIGAYLFMRQVLGFA